MKKSIPFIFIILMMSLSLVAQQQFENPGFEDWEDAGTVIEEPTNWSSIKTSDAGQIINDAAPVVWAQSDDAHSGNYSLKLFNTAAFTIVASGTISNGRVHADFNPELGYVYTQHDDDRWHTAFSSHPDSLVFWYKAFPVGNDFGKVRVILHVDEGKFPENGTFQNWIGEAIYYFPQQQVTEWTRVSVPFTYHLSGNSEYLLCVCNSGNGTNAVEGSEAYFDDLELIYNPEWIHETILEGVSLYTYNNSIVLKIDRPSDFSQLQMEIFDLTGRSLLSRQFNPSPELVCPVNLRQGMYICRIMSGNGIYTSKIYIR